MLFVDYNSSIRDIFKRVEGISQIGLDELFDEEVIAGNRSYAEAIISAELASKEDILSLVAEYLGYELQIGEIGEIDAETISSIQPEIAKQYGPNISADNILVFAGGQVPLSLESYSSFLSQS